jgi:hypothetical protein
LVRGGCYKEALKLAGKILVLDPDNATVQEFQLVLAEGATLRTLWSPAAFDERDARRRD